MITIRVQVMWSSQSLSIFRRKARAFGENFGAAVIDACACSECPAEKSRTSAALRAATAAASESCAPRPRFVFRVMLDLLV
jgi:hypothetical protein